MTISAWLLTLTDAETPVPDALLGDPDVTLGQRSDHRLPLVVSRDRPDETLLVGDALRDLPGVAGCDLVCVLQDGDLVQLPEDCDGRNR